MTLTIGLIIWMLAIMCVLRFLAVSSHNQQRNKNPDYFKATCSCGHTTNVRHLRWEAIKCKSCGMYYEKKEFSIK